MYNHVPVMYINIWHITKAEFSLNWPLNFQLMHSKQIPKHTNYIFIPE